MHHYPKWLNFWNILLRIIDLSLPSYLYNAFLLHFYISHPTALSVQVQKCARTMVESPDGSFSQSSAAG